MTIENIHHAFTKQLMGYCGSLSCMELYDSLKLDPIEPRAVKANLVLLTNINTRDSCASVPSVRNTLILSPKFGVLPYSLSIKEVL